MSLVLVRQYPIAGMLPGADHGSLENVENTLTMLGNNATLRQLSICFCVLVFVLNSFSVLVTFMLSSVWHAILDNFRPISIWAVQIVLYYYVTDGQHGEPWGEGSFLQLIGLFVMLLGTAVYNGSFELPGLKSNNLLSSNSKMASPALQRSPLVTMNNSQVLQTDQHARTHSLW